MRKFITSILFLLVLSTGFAQRTSFTIDGMLYESISDSTVGLVSKYEANSDSIIIPSKFTYAGKTYTVTSIYPSAFSNYTALKSIMIPNTVTDIGYYAFMYCTKLTSIIIPNSVNLIGTCAFLGCSNLSSIRFPDSLKSLGSAAFSNTAWFEMQPDGVLYIGKVLYTYKGNKPAELKIIIKDGTLDIAEDAFNSLGADEYSLISITIPNSVKSIESSAFEGCKGLTSVTIPSTIDYIGNDAFRECTSLTTATTPFTWSGGNKFSDCTLLTSIIIPNDITTIKPYAFNELGTLTSITIPNTISSIGDNAFSSCSRLTTVNLSNSVTSIGRFAFSYCSALTSINIPNSVTSLEGGTFYNCSALNTIYIPKSVTSMGGNPFAGTGWYNSLPDGVVYAGKIACAYKGSMSNESEISLKDSTIAIAGSTFSGFYILQSIHIPSSVVSIGINAFYNCLFLTSVYANSSVPVTISDGTFHKVNKSRCNLYVPIGSKSLYQTALYWKDFNNIIEIQNTETPQINNIEILPSYNSFSGTLQLKGLEGSDLLVSIYNLHGNKVISTNTTDNKPLYVGYLAAGVYVIQITNGREKFMTRKMIVP